MKKFFMIAIIASLLTSFSFTAFAVESIDDFSIPAETCPPGQSNSAPAAKATKLPRIFIIVNGDEEWQVRVRDIVGPAIHESGKAQIAPFNAYLDWSNAASDYARTSGRYEEKSVPAFGKYIAPTHEGAVSNTFNWKTTKLSGETLSGLWRNNGSNGIQNAALSITTLEIEVTLQVYNLKTSLLEYTAKGKGKASMEYLSINGYTMSQNDDVVTRALSNAVKKMVQTMNLSKKS